MSRTADEIQAALERRRVEREAEDRRGGSHVDARPLGEKLREMLEHAPRPRADEDPDPIGLLLRGLANEAHRGGDQERGQHIEWFLDMRKWDLDGRKGNKPWEPNQPPVSGKWEDAKYQRGKRYEADIKAALDLAELRLAEWEAKDAELAESESER